MHGTAMVQCSTIVRSHQRMNMQKRQRISEIQEKLHKLRQLVLVHPQVIGKTVEEKCSLASPRHLEARNKKGGSKQLRACIATHGLQLFCDVLCGVHLCSTAVRELFVSAR